MNQKTKVLIAYDGSASADAAIEDLPQAGLAEAVEAVVLSVADVWYYPSPADASSPLVTPLDREILRRGEEMRQRAMLALGEKEICAGRAVSRLREFFPSWAIRAETAIDSPGWAIIKKAEEWGADLVVVGAGEHSFMERVQLGSVSQKVLAVCQCSVRVARRSTAVASAPVRLLIGLDGSPHAELAMTTVAQRHWPKGGEVRLISVLDGRLAVAVPSLIPGLARWHRGKESAADNQAWLHWMMEGAAETLKGTGLEVSRVIVQGDPRDTLVETAASWQADTIFVGARGLSGIERFLIGSVSSAVAARAGCSVEVVRGALPNP
jgi:nucleotide-binding universal stress UspA family protein